MKKERKPKLETKEQAEQFLNDTIKAIETFNGLTKKYSNLTVCGRMDNIQIYEASGITIEKLANLIDRKSILTIQTLGYEHNENLEEIFFYYKGYKVFALQENKEQEKQ